MNVCYNLVIHLFHFCIWHAGAYIAYLTDVNVLVQTLIHVFFFLKLAKLKKKLHYLPFVSTRDDLILPYNQAATKLAFHSSEISKDKLDNMKLVIYYCHPGACQATQILVHFYMLITLKHKSSWEVCEPVLCWKTLIYWMDICCKCTLELPLWGNSNVYQQHMLLKLRKPILKYTLNKYHFHCLSSFKHLKLPKYLLYGKLFILTWQLYHQIWFHELCFCKAGSCMVVNTPTTVLNIRKSVTYANFRHLYIWSLTRYTVVLVCGIS